MARESFHAELEALQAKLVRMGTLVEQAIHDAVKSLEDRDEELAHRVVMGDDAIDTLHLELEQDCFSLLALQQPMAGDLRTISTALKIVTDLERMADHASDIAQTTLRLGGEPLIKPLLDIPRMAEIAQGMVRDSLTAYIRRDVDLALEMINRDHQVDHLYAQVFHELIIYMMETPRLVGQGIQLLFVASYLERIADHATNLGEWILYMVTGERKQLNN